MEKTPTLIELTADIVSAHVSNNNVAVGDVPNLVAQVHQALSRLGAAPAEPASEKPQPAVTVRSSIKPDALVCLECGQKQKVLRRHIATAHDLTPEQYRTRFDLKSDYPMVAPDYSKKRSELAQAIGLGRGGKKQPAPKARGRKASRASGSQSG